MKKSFAALLLAVVMLVSACASKQTAAPETEARIVAEESTAAARETEEQSVPATETAAATEAAEETESVAQTETAAATEAAAEAETRTENGVFPSRSINLDAAELRPEDGIWASGGNRVYFGQYDGQPTAYRVLASPETQTASGDKGSLLLDCDTSLDLKQFDDNFSKNDGQIKLPSEWMGSDIEVWLNGNDFYGSSAVFSDVEKSAIVVTTLDEESAVYTIGNWTYEDYGSICKVFLLSAAEANQLYAEDAARVKVGSSNCWWLRSAFGSVGNGAGSVHGDGHICNNSICMFGVGVSPALNVDLSSILFVSAIGTDKSLDLAEPGAKVEDSSSREWKMTLLDTGKTVKITDGQAVTRTDTNAGIVITVPYTYAGDDVTQISVMITDKAYTDSGAQVLYYGALQGTPADNTAGTGTFTLPSDLKNQTCGADYYVYIIAENVNGDHRTDYASEAYEIAIPASIA